LSSGVDGDWKDVQMVDSDRALWKQLIRPMLG